MKIHFEDPGLPEITRLIDALDAYQRPLYPPESHHGVDLDALRRANVLFAVARAADGRALGCGALVLQLGYGELKRMYVPPEHRGRGVAKAILVFLESAARAQGCTVFMLETGVRQTEALAMYERAGYVRCAPFGEYAPDPVSVFMMKQTQAGSCPP